MIVRKCTLTNVIVQEIGDKGVISLKSTDYHEEDFYEFIALNVNLCPYKWSYEAYVSDETLETNFPLTNSPIADYV